MKTRTVKRFYTAFALAGISLCISCQQAEKNAPEIKTEPMEETKVEAPDMPVSSSALQELFGDKLVKADGSEVSLDALKGKTIGIYFSAHWCPPCRQFTPVLVKTYNELVKSGKPFEIVFVSSDRSKEAMQGYMEETGMAWTAIPYGSEQKNKLSSKYGVRGIPTFVVVNADGELITKAGRRDVAQKGVDAFAEWNQ
jgi:nucleoredoxin